MKNILFLINCNHIGGAEYVSMMHVKTAIESGFNVTVLSGERGNFYDEIRKADVKIFHCPELNSNNNVAINNILTAYIFDIDIVVNENWFAITPNILALKPLFQFKYTTVVHSNIKWVTDKLKPFDKQTDRYYAIHNGIKQTLNDNGLGINKTFVIPNCIDTSLITSRNHEINFAQRVMYYIPENDIVIGMITRIAADKNIFDAVRIVDKVNDYMPATLVIIGDAPDNAACQKYKADLITLIGKTKHPDKFKLLGQMTTENVYNHLNLFDIGLNTSPSEGLPIALLEMMAAGIYCIFPGIGDIPNELTGRGDVIPIRQRLLNEEIFSANCYNDSEKQLFIEAIIKESTYD